MATYINSNDHSLRFNAILDLVQTVGYLTTDDVAEITAVVNKNLNWQDLNFSGIENWFNENAPTPAPTEAPTEAPTAAPTQTSPTQAPTTTSPSESNSLIASFTIIIAVTVLCKLFI